MTNDEGMTNEEMTSRVKTGVMMTIHFGVTANEPLFAKILR